MDIKQKNLFTGKSTAGGKMFYFDVMEASNGNMYLVIDEKRKNGNEWISNRVMVFEDNIFSFNEHLNKAIRFLMDKAAAKPKKK